jgi:hypothetical protein
MQSLGFSQEMKTKRKLINTTIFFIFIIVHQQQILKLLHKTSVFLPKNQYKLLN